ncbi:uncharacterized protein LOC143277957 isoform X2 [Babylonia areolata]|uniref:uncharacterized protein LOC143277957 isoform X2 n=1 Tax=Babylonia areolata TaxID=304850 RepID=UPI003FD633BF
MGLQDYLAFCVQALERIPEFPVVHVVRGNEACDLDSAVSAIAYAYFLHETSVAPVGTALFLPLLNIPRGDFPLRTEIVHLLGKYGIGAGDLIFRDDLDLLQVKGSATDLKLTLVDHHVLGEGEAEGGLEENVVQILDHRPKEGSLPDTCESTIELVGSCTTLVAEAMLAEDTFTMDPVCATLLYGTIVTDTINFSPAAGKATPKDRDMAGRLEEVVEGGLDRDSLYEEIKAAKFDLSGLNSMEILRKDMKMVSGDSLMVAMSSVTMDMEALVGRADFADSLKSFAKGKGVDAVVVMTLSTGPDDSVSRQLGVFSPSRVYRQQMADVLNASQSPNLGLSPLPSSSEDFLTFSQSNVKASRKQVLPIIKSFLAGETTPDETQMDAYDLPKDQSEGFTSMSSIVGSRQDTSEGDISSEDLISREESVEDDLLAADNLLPVADRKVFDPLSSVHSSDSGATSPQDSSKNADGGPGGGAGPKALAVGGGEDANNGDDSPVGAVVWDDIIDVSEGSSNQASATPTPTTTQDVAAPPLPSSAPQPIVSTCSPSPPAPEEASGNNPAGFNHNNADPSQHNGLGEVGEGGDDDDDEDNDDALEQDFLNMASPHDLLFPTDSPLDVSASNSGQVSGQTSGQTSGHASKAPSYPVTPPNSYMDDGVMDKEVQLPSFNSSEMVEKIQEKKAALGPAGSREDAGEEDPPLSPFTPQNSYVDSASSFPPPRETQLPSLNSSDMVERIREKRTSMEREVLGAEGARWEGQGAGDDANLLDVERSPFTPHNSFVEGSSFDRYARDNLPSLNNAEIAARIRQRQAELTAAAGGGVGGGEDSGTASPMGSGAHDSSSSPAAPYTPQNSFRDSPMDALLNLDPHVTDLNEVAERLSLTGSESSGSLNEPRSVKASNRVHMAGLSPQEAASSGGFFSGAGETNQSSEASSMVSSGTAEPPSKELNFDLDSTSTGVKRKGVTFSQQRSSDDAESDVAEEAIQKIAYELANEMIQKALETFPSESVKELVPPEASGGGEERTMHPSISEDSSPTMDESDQDLSSSFSAGIRAGMSAAVGEGSGTPDSALASSTESEQFAAHFSQQPSEGSAMKMSSSLADELAQALSGAPADGGNVSSLSPEEEEEEGGGGVAKSESYEIETEYLCDMDPMQKMGVFNPEANVIETDADKEVVEGASFRKISGQEYQTVQEEILEQIRQEAKEREITQLQRSSVAEEDAAAGAHSPTAADSDDDNGSSGDKGHHDPSADKKKIAPEGDLNLDDSLTDEQGKRTLHVMRDKELYASTLENERAVIDVLDQRTLQPSDASHPLLEATPPAEEEPRIEDHSKRKIQAPDSAVSGGHRYESFAETGSLETAEERTGGSKTQGKSGVVRTVSSVSETSLKGVELCDEWQDDELPRMLGAEASALAEDPETQGAEAAANAGLKRVVPDPGLLADGDTLENAPVVDSDSEVDSDIDNEQLEWETRKLLRDDTPVRTPPAKRAAKDPETIPQYTAAEERRDTQSWKIVRVGEGEEFRLDMRVIEPYKRVLSHGGYCGEGLTAMIVFSACYLPSRDRRDYSYVMNHLFHYVLHTLDELVADDYMIVYFHGATPRRQMPSFSWLKKCYQGIDRRLKKNLKALYLVHPTLWLKTVVVMTRPFISAKFSSKLQFVRTLADLKRLIPMEYVYIPEIVQRLDKAMMFDNQETIEQVNAEVDLERLRTEDRPRAGNSQDLLLAGKSTPTGSP